MGHPLQDGLLFAEASGEPRAPPCPFVWGKIQKTHTSKGGLCGAPGGA